MLVGLLAGCAGTDNNSNETTDSAEPTSSAESTTDDSAEPASSVEPTSTVEPTTEPVIKTMQWEEREFNIYELRDNNPMGSDYEDVSGKIIEIVFQLDGKGNYMFFMNIPFRLYDSKGTEYMQRGDMYMNSGPDALYSRRFDVPVDTDINDLSLGFNDERFELKNYMDCLVAK